MTLEAINSNLTYRIWTSVPNSIFCHLTEQQEKYEGGFLSSRGLPAADPGKRGTAGCVLQDLPQSEGRKGPICPFTKSKLLDFSEEWEMNEVKDRLRDSPNIFAKEWFLNRKRWELRSNLRNAHSEGFSV